MKAAWSIVCGLALCALVVGCSSDACTKGRTECVSDSVLRACVPGSDGNEWFTYQCGENERCSDTGEPAASADAGAASASGGEPACVGTCTTGDSECVGDSVARYCADGRAWQLRPCEAGQRCVDGSCVYADGGVQVCEPGARECGSDETEKVCDQDGSKWIEQTCDEAEKCLVDRCAPDPDASCDSPSRCMDNKTALRCLGQDKGFELVSCAGDTYCEGGRCRGAVCALGSVCNAQNQVVECTDGASLKVTQCGVNEVCNQERDRASCVPKPCEPGQIRCGDPRDDSVDTMKFYSQCEPGAQTASGLPEWVVGECTGLLTCDPARAQAGSPCQQECTPGAQTCMQDPVFGVADGRAECQDDGTWGPVQSCNQGGGLRSQCAIKQTLDASALPEAICVDPVCAVVIEQQDGEGGSCSGAEIQRCDENGKLGDPQPCEVGICRATLLETQSDGRVPGACDTDVQCEDGEERCLLDNLIPTTLYQVCESGFWSSKLETCTDDGQCIDYVDGKGLRKKVCGADCAPGEKRCNVSDQVETCDQDGKWSGAESCDVGVCSTLGTMPGKRDAACVLECIPGEVQCTGSMMAASDGVSTGYSQQAVCGQDGLLGTPEDCAAGETCRVSSAGEHTGCVECLGPNVLGGNDWGYMDTRCDPAALEQVQECGTDNSWSASRACNGGKSCRMVNGATCGQCTIASTLMTCTETNLSALEEVCGPCSDPALGSSPLAVCREASISSLTSAAESCASLFGDGSATEYTGYPAGTAYWGGYYDCCDGMTSGGTDGEFLQHADCASRGYGTPTAAGAVDDCCSLYVTAGSGPAFAYCAVP